MGDDKRYAEDNYKIYYHVESHEIGSNLHYPCLRNNLCTHTHTYIYIIMQIAVTNQVIHKINQDSMQVDK